MTVTDALRAESGPALIPSLQGIDLFRSASYIGGNWLTGSKSIAVDNPATGEIIGHVPDLGEAEATEAVDAAEKAFAGWKTRTGKERGKILRRWGELITENKDNLARILTAEQGKPLSEARDEVDYAASYLEWFAEEARRIDGDVLTPHRSDRRIMVVRQPIGVVAAITPWNFPLAMITRKAGPALAVGCTMVLKPAGFTPFSALALAKLGEDAGIPAGVFNVITGNAQAIGNVLTSDQRVRKLTFTGSTAVGKRLAAQCMQTVKRLSLNWAATHPSSFSMMLISMPRSKAPSSPSSAILARPVSAPTASSFRTASMMNLRENWQRVLASLSWVMALPDPATRGRLSTIRRSPMSRPMWRMQ